MIGTKFILVACTIIAFCKSASIVDKIDKCASSDSECQKQLYKTLLLEIADNGIPEMDIPRIDPYVIKNRTIKLLGLIEATMIDGSVIGFKSCKANSFVADLPNHRAIVELECDNFGVEGKYKIDKTPALSAFLGGIDIHGEGSTKVVIEKIKVNLYIACDVKKFDNGEIHLHVNSADTTYTYKLLGKIIIAADNLYIGSQEISAVAVNILNENTEFISRLFGNTIMEEALNVFYTEVNKFLDVVPVDKFISDDVSTYIN